MVLRSGAVHVRGRRRSPLSADPWEDLILGTDPRSARYETHVGGKARDPIGTRFGHEVGGLPLSPSAGRAGGGLRFVAYRVVHPSAEDPDDPFAEDVRRPFAFDSVPVYVSDSHGKTAPVASLDTAHSRSCCASSSAYGS